MQSNGIHSEPPTPLRDLVRGLETKLDKHVDQQQELYKRIDRLCHVVLGDPEAKVNGLVHHVDEHRKYISRDKRLKWFGAGLAATGGSAGLMGFWDKFKHLFNNI
jgi:hypothetical protein